MLEHPELHAGYATDHYNCICSKAHHSLNLIRCTISMNNTISTKQLLYYTLVRSHLTFCSQLWRPYLIQDIVRLERIQCKATKYILNWFSIQLNLQTASHFTTYATAYVLARAPRHYVFHKMCQRTIRQFNINQNVTFAQGNTRSASSKKTDSQSCNILNNTSLLF